MEAVARTFDAALINRVLNHPEVFPWVAAPGIERFDFSEVAKDPANYVLVNEYGGFVFVPKGEGRYEVHTQFIPEGRRGALRAAREAAAFMFEGTDCTEILTYVPEGNRGAKRLTELMHFEFLGRDGFWTYPDGRQVPIDWYLLTKEAWQCQPLQS